MPTYALSFKRFAAGVLAIAAAACATPAGAESKPAESKAIIVALDRAKIIKLPDNAQTMIIGNPLVADVTMLKGNGSMVVTGRGFGSTNLILLDSAGALMEEATIKVVPSDQSVVVMRGTAQESYSCNPRCSPVVALGDDAKFMNESLNNAKMRNGAAAAGGK